MKPAYRITVDGKDITPQLRQSQGVAGVRPRLISLGIAQRRGEEADQLDLIVDDSDGKLALPPEGAKIEVAIGWRTAGGDDLTPMGSYIVDEVQHSGPPDQITIRAHAADFTRSLTERRERSWRDGTLGTVIAEIAARHGLTPRVAPILADKPVRDLSQNREGDIAFLRRLGREHDAVATIKAGHLIFAPVGAGETATGKPLPTMTIRRSEGDAHNFSVKTREEFTGVTAAWHDRGSARRKTVTAGEAGKTRRLSRTYATEAEARDAATAAKSRADRQPVEFSVTLALGRADLAPEQRLSVAGYKPQMDERSWLIEQVQHSISDRGFTTQVTLQAT